MVNQITLSSPLALLPNRHWSKCEKDLPVHTLALQEAHRKSERDEGQRTPNRHPPRDMTRKSLSAPRTEDTAVETEGGSRRPARPHRYLQPGWLLPDNRRGRGSNQMPQSRLHDHCSLTPLEPSSALGRNTPTIRALRRMESSKKTK